MCYVVKGYTKLYAFILIFNIYIFNIYIITLTQFSSAIAIQKYYCVIE